jgi:CDP-diacylglycerol---glycerol-3-phosphate 3-phosphatidyltransferase
VSSPRTLDVGVHREYLLTSATLITGVRTVASLVLSLLAAVDQSLTLLVAALIVYWVGDMLDGAVARWRGCETRIGAVIDIMCDRLNCAGFYLGLCWIEPHVIIPVGIYLASFMVVDTFLSIAFLAWPIRSPNYFYAVDERIWRWNWSKPAKAANSALFAVLLLVDGLWWVALVVAALLASLKLVSLSWLMRLGLPVPVETTPADATPTSDHPR